MVIPAVFHQFLTCHYVRAKDRAMHNPQRNIDLVTKKKAHSLCILTLFCVRVTSFTVLPMADQTMLTSCPKRKQMNEEQLVHELDKHRLIYDAQNVKRGYLA